jgi:hypothetical protein
MQEFGKGFDYLRPPLDAVNVVHDGNNQHDSITHDTRSTLHSSR